MRRTEINGQVMVEYLLVCGFIVAMFVAPIISPQNNNNEQRSSVGQLLIETTQNNLGAWHFGTRIAD